MQYSALDQDYLRRLDTSVLQHSADQYQSALNVIRDEASGHSQPLCEYLERCLESVLAELDRRTANVPENPVKEPLTART